MVITGCFKLYNYFNAVMSGSHYFSFGIVSDDFN